MKKILLLRIILIIIFMATLIIGFVLYFDDMP